MATRALWSRALRVRPNGRLLTPWQQRHHATAPELDALLSALQRRDGPRLHEAFIAWTDLLADESSPAHAAAIRRAQSLPGPTLSEILRSLDPIASSSSSLSSSSDVAHGLLLSAGQTQFIDISSLIDDYGVRRIHRRILSGMHTLLSIRHPLSAPDYSIMMRCAGAAADYHSSKLFWSSMARHALAPSRTSASWTDFITARFLLHPTYYQFDRSRVAVLARDLHSNHHPLRPSTLKRLDRLRLSLNAFKKNTWNRRPDEPSEDLRRLLRRRADYRGFKNHWVRSLYYGREPDEALLCASMVAFARSSSLFAIRHLILDRHYGVTIHNVSNPARTIISGGRDFPANSLLRPTVRLLDAIVEALGAMSHIALASRLLVFFSRRYNLPIPHETWSNLLSWTYLQASKPFSTMRRIHGPHPATTVSPADARLLWETMSEGEGFTPSIDDIDIYVKTLILQRCFAHALTIITTHAIPLYTSLVASHRAALLDDALRHDALRNDALEFNHPRSSTRRRRAEILKDRAHHLISSCFAKLIATATADSSQRQGFAHVTIPNLIRDFPGFFHQDIRYRSAQGIVSLRRPDPLPRYQWTPRFRLVGPQKVAGIYVRDFERSDLPDFPWPTTQPMRVREWVRTPRKRPAVLDPAPARQGDNASDWRNQLEEQLML